MKTALELLIDEMRLKQSAWSENIQAWNTLTFAMRKATELLPTEKQQIIDIYNAAQTNCINILFDELKKELPENVVNGLIAEFKKNENSTDAEDYYTQTFKDK